MGEPRLAAASVVAVGPRGEDVGGGEGEDGGEERSEVDLTPALAAAPAAPYSGRRKVNLVRVSFTSDPEEDPAAARLLCALQQRTGRDSSVLQFMAWGVDQPEDVGSARGCTSVGAGKIGGSHCPPDFSGGRGFFDAVSSNPSRQMSGCALSGDRSDQGPGLFCSPATVRITAMTKVAVGTHICGDWNTMLHHFNDIFAELSRSAAVAVQAAVEWRENVVRIDLVPRERGEEDAGEETIHVDTRDHCIASAGSEAKVFCQCMSRDIECRGGRWWVSREDATVHVEFSQSIDACWALGHLTHKFRAYQRGNWCTPQPSETYIWQRSSRVCRV